MKKILGTMRIPATAPEIKTWLQTAAKAGYDWLDFAYVYGGEDRNAIAIAPVLKELAKEGITFKIQSKIWTSHFKEVEKYTKLQLKNLQIKKFDALLLHRPSINFYESIDAWKDLIKMQAKGYVDAIGVSNFENDMIRLLQMQTSVTPAINQIENSVNYFRGDRVSFAKRNNIELQGWSVLGKYLENNLKNPIVLKLAKKHRVEPSQILLAFSSAQEIWPVIGSTNPANIELNAHFVDLNPAEIKELLEINTFENRFGESYPLH